MRADGQQKIEIGKRDPYYKPVKQHQNDTRKQKRMEEAFEAEFFGVPSPTNSNSNSLNARDLGSRAGGLVFAIEEHHDPSPSMLGKPKTLAIG